MRINVERKDLRDWLDQLKAVPRADKYAGLWKRVLKLSSVPSRRRPTVNLYKINRYSAVGENILVPGKVLSEGQMDHKITITAMEFSATALARLREAQCKVIKLDAMLKEKKIRVIV